MNAPLNNSPQAKSEAEILMMCNLPGPEGVLWRLIREWNPDQITNWMRIEEAKGTPLDQATFALGNLLGTVAYVYVQNTGDRSIVDAFQRSLQAKINADKRRSGGGIILPTDAVKA